MIKKAAILAVVGLAGATVLTQTKLGSYALAFFNKAEDKINESVPPDWELERIRNEVSRLDADIEETKGLLAKARVEARVVRADVEKIRPEIDATEAQILRLGAAITSASKGDTIKWEGRSLTVAEAKQELQTEVARHRNRRDELRSKEKMLEIRERNRDLLGKQLTAMIQQKSELATAVDKLDAEINLAKLEQVESRYQNDGSRMAGVKKALQELEKRVAYQREKLTISQQFAGRDNAADKTVDEILGDQKGGTPTANAE
jgi:chromosome segregation ATPase